MKLAVLALALGSAAASAQASDALAQKHSCIGCHQAEAKVVGPSYKDIAAKYKGQAGAAEALVKKINAGGTGVWGAIPMPPMPQVSEADAKALVGWILAR